MPEHQQIQQSKKPNTNFQKQATPVIHIPLSNPYSIIQRAKINPKSLTHADVMQLQRTIGNRAVAQLLSGIVNSSAAHEAPIQRSEIPEEEEKPMQGKFETVQRSEIPEEGEPLQGKMIGTVQRQKIPEEEEPLQGKFESVQRQEIPQEKEPLQTKRENNTGMADNLKAGVENLSGIDMSDVRVHYNSTKPAEVGALAYTQGADIHISPGQERHLPHETWHVVQQAQGRVKPTMQAKSVAINDDERLEREADVMGRKALQQYARVEKQKENKSRAAANSVAQKKSVKQSFGFLDNRSEAIQLRKLQSMAVNNTAQHHPIQRIANYSTLEEPIIRMSDYGVDTKAVVQRNKKGAAAGVGAGAAIGALGFLAGPIVGGITTAIGAGIGGVVLGTS